MPYIIIDGYVTWVTGSGGVATVTALDGTDDAFSPTFMTTLDASSESLNIETQLLSGEIAVTLVGDADQAGTLAFVFTDDTSVTAARAILRRPTSFSLEVPDRPALNMTFVRSGSLSPVIHDAAKDVWQVSVGFREVT